MPTIAHPHTWTEAIETHSAADFVRILGCPAPTAYSWKRAIAPRHPPKWMQTLILEALRRDASRRKT